MMDAFFAYRKQLFVVAGVVAAGSLFYGGYSSWQCRRDEKASDAYVKALSHLEKLQKTNPMAPKDDDKKKQEEKNKQLKTAQQAFRQVRLDCPWCKVSGLAALNEAQLSLQLGQHEQALKIYQNFIESCAPHNELCAWAMLGQARAQEARGKQKEALTQLENATAQWQKTPAESFVQWYMVRLAHHLGKNDKVQTYAKQLQERFPNAWMSQQAKQLIQQPTTREDS